jgi:beta-lactam-binding protein with PASTA domain
VVPNVVGLNHQLAQDTMQAAGFYNLTEEDASGQGRLLINDRNWVVVTQQPAGGIHAAADTTIILRSKKIGE